LHLPAAPESEVAVFPQLYADIGDEQSIEQNLSTFSSHLAAIVEILRALADHPLDGSRALVLLDEVGAGTDPTEGVALARALIEALHNVGACTAVTTHYNELKAMPYTHPGMENASVEFDEATLRPTFRLLIGTPGRSHAFAIAERLGLDPRIVAQARSAVSRQDADLTGVFQSVAAERDALLREREALAQERADCGRLRAAPGSASSWCRSASAGSCTPPRTATARSWCRPARWRSGCRCPISGGSLRARRTARRSPCRPRAWGRRSRCPPPWTCGGSGRRRPFWNWTNTSTTPPSP